MKGKFSKEKGKEILRIELGCNMRICVHEKTDPTLIRWITDHTWSMMSKRKK